MNYITYQVELTEANAGLIDELNKLLIPSYTITDSEPVKEKQEKKEKGPTLTAVKKAVKAAKADHGEAHCIACAEEAGVETDGLTLAKIVGAVDADNYAEFIAALESPPEESDDLDEDDDLDDDMPEVTSDDVRAAVKAFAADNGNEDARAAMKKCNISKLKEIDSAKQKTLDKLFALVTE